MNLSILITIAFYSLLTIVLAGIASRKSLPGIRDYFVASGTLGWLHLGLTLFATWFSTWSFLGSTGFFL